MNPESERKIAENTLKSLARLQSQSAAPSLKNDLLELARTMQSQETAVFSSAKNQDNARTDAWLATKALAKAIAENESQQNMADKWNNAISLTKTWFSSLN
jgi:mevalonate pyrophosphate decarboxylase